MIFIICNVYIYIYIISGPNTIPTLTYCVLLKGVKPDNMKITVIQFNSNTISLIKLLKTQYIAITIFSSGLSI